MKKYLSKRGFTIVEVMVAFVIFAIMAGMVSVILSQTYRAKQENTDLEDEIQGQREAYYLKDQDKEYNSADKEGTLTFNFDGMSALNVGYDIGNPNAEGDDNQIALEYFIGDVDYKSITDGKKQNNDKAGNNVGSVMSRLDSRIYGSTGINKISIKLEKDNTYTGTGCRYCIWSMATYNGLEQQRWFAQYRLIFPSKILDYGYVSVDSKENVTGFSSRFLYNSKEYEVYAPYSRTLRISSKQSSDESDPWVISGKYTRYYVVLTSPLEDIDAGLDVNKIFGYSNSDQTSTKSESGSYEFTPYSETITEEGGTTSTANYPNIFGAFPREEETLETPSTGEAPESTSEA